MRVLIATRYLAVVGGVETYLRAVLPRLAAAGCELGVLHEEPAAGPAGTILDGTPVGAVFHPAGRPTAAVVREVGGWRPDVVFGNGVADPGLEAALIDAFPAVFFAHVYQGTCVSGTKCWTRPGGPRPCHRTLGPGCMAVYPARGCGGWNPVTMVGLYRTQRRRQATLGRYRGVAVASRHMADEVRRHGVHADRVRVVPLFPPAAAPDPAPPPPRPASGRVLFVGRATALKGLDHLVAALPRAAAALGRRLTLVVAGDGPARAGAETAARAAGLPAEFLGWVGADRVVAEMRAADVLAVPSVWPEPFGLAGVEAGCVGLPAVGYATGGIPDWLDPGVTGESAPGTRPDPRELAAAVVRALADDDRRHRLGVGAWEAARRFSPEAHLAGLLPVLARAAVTAPTPTLVCG